MRFDSNRAWQEATALVKANRSLVWVIAGAFMVVPAFTLSIIAPPPQPPAGADGDALIALMTNYYAQHWVWVIAFAALQLLGTLAMLALFTDRTRPTVGEALAQGARATLPVIAAQVLVGMALMLAATAIIVPTTLVGLGFIGLLICFGGFLYVMVRLAMIAPAVLVDGIANPLLALRRSWDLTKGNVGRIGVFLLLLAIGMGLVVLLGSGLADAGLRLLLGRELGEPLGAIVSAALQSAMAVYFTAVYATIHAQLAGRSDPSIGRNFE